MGVRGRKPLPAGLRLVTGNRGKRAIPALVELSRPAEIACPASVANDERALAYWQTVICEARHLRVIDAPLLALLVKALARADKIEAMLGDEYLRPGRQGTVRNPLTGILHATTDVVRKLSADLALTPPERARLNVREPAPADPAEKFFND